MSDLRAMIRELLREELATLKSGAASAKAAREETVSIRSDADLATFVARLLKLDPTARSDIQAGRHIFRLGSAPIETQAPLQRSAPAPVRFDRGLITEKDVARLPDGLRSISISKNVRFTPLARDELRRLHVKIERMGT